MAGSRWARIDVQLARNPKVRQLRDAGDLALFVCSILYCAAELTDGFVARRALDVLTTDARLTRRNVLARAARLCTAGLWVEVEGGWLLSGFVEHNRQATRAYVEAERAAWRDRQAEHRALSRRDRSAHHGVTDRGVTGTTRHDTYDTHTQHWSPSAEPNGVGPIIEQMAEQWRLDDAT